MLKLRGVLCFFATLSPYNFLRNCFTRLEFLEVLQVPELSYGMWIWNFNLFHKIHNGSPKTPKNFPLCAKISILGGHKSLMVRKNTLKPNYLINPCKCLLENVKFCICKNFAESAIHPQNANFWNFRWIWSNFRELAACQRHNIFPWNFDTS